MFCPSELAGGTPHTVRCNISTGYGLVQGKVLSGNTQKCNNSCKNKEFMHNEGKIKYFNDISTNLPV